MTPLQAKAVTEEVIALYRNYGEQDYIGEAVSQLEHMCQAALLAETQGYDEEVILAAFFHDIGHLCEHIMTVSDMEGFGVADHEYIGANFLRDKGYSEKIASLVEGHVQAKRYLTFKNPAYEVSLSQASKETLRQQGGPMNANEAEDFENNDMYQLFIRIREWDDQAKIVDVPLPNLDKYFQMSFRHLLSQ